MKKIFSIGMLWLLISFCLQAETMVVATFNIRNANGGDSISGNGWGQRYPYIAQMAQFHGFEIFGTQEGKYHQLQDLKTAMPGYDYIGVGRDDGKLAGEFSAIFYKTDRFEVLEHGVLHGVDVWGRALVELPGGEVAFYDSSQVSLRPSISPSTVLPSSRGAEQVWTTWPSRSWTSRTRAPPRTPRS